MKTTPTIPELWQQVDTTALSGTIMIIGGVDVGKSTFARYLFRRLAVQHGRVAFLDGDPGQSTLGLPTTLTLQLCREGEADFPPKGNLWRRFVGWVSPAGHMLPMVVGAARLVEAAQQAGAQAIVWDTTGLIDPAQGGVALKWAQIELIRPAVIFAFQRERELEPLIGPLRRSGRVAVVELPPSPFVQPRDFPTRQRYRSDRFAAYFRNADLLSLRWSQWAVFPVPHFVHHQLVALEDRAGFTLGLGIVKAVDPAAREIVLLTPLRSLKGVNMLHTGDLTVDPETFQEMRLPRWM
ncbi:MAG: hypothetical protein D6681_07485 [Calditrichaeota bacterium]|nr:MAG: hypothetical protein D6681_07485 [Calditrichota bacterium]